jgi:hypothetical protein
MLEQDAAQRREQRTYELIGLRLREEQLKLREQLEHMRIGFDLEAIKFEKQMHEKACDLVSQVKRKHSETLQALSNRIDHMK